MVASITSESPFEEEISWLCSIAPFMIRGNNERTLDKKVAGQRIEHGESRPFLAGKSEYCL